MRGADPWGPVTTDSKEEAVKGTESLLHGIGFLAWTLQYVGTSQSKVNEGEACLYDIP